MREFFWKENLIINECDMIDVLSRLELLRFLFFSGGISSSSCGGVLGRVGLIRDNLFPSFPSGIDERTDG